MESENKPTAQNERYEKLRQEEKRLLEEMQKQIAEANQRHEETIRNIKEEYAKKQTNIDLKW